MGERLKPQKMKTEIEEDQITIWEDDGETPVVTWNVQEWTDEPEIVTAIANAIRLACLDPEQLRSLVGMQERK